jgi:hypothetical protein
VRVTIDRREQPEVAEDLAEVVAENAEVEADEDDQCDDDPPAYVFIERRAVRGSLPPR